MPYQGTRRRVFISHYRGDRGEVDNFINYFANQEQVLTPYVLGANDNDDFIDSTNTDYVMTQVRNRYLQDTTVTIVLIGSCTHSRRYVDWEIKTSLRKGAYTPNGLIGILLPSRGRSAHLPPRFQDNWHEAHQNCYARYMAYLSSAQALGEWIEDAFAARTNRAHLINNPQDMMSYNARCKVCNETHREYKMDIFRIYFDTQKYSLSFDISPWFIVLLVVLSLFGFILRFNMRHYRLVKLDISLGNIGKAEFKPNTEDLQIAHSIWTELVTRKAAIPIDPDHDVIMEVYASWYALFTTVQELIANLPADLVKREKSTREIVRIATATLNDGLRPHLTKWQARFRNWYDGKQEELKNKSPQELQKEFPEYNELVSDMIRINVQLIDYANELKRMLGG